MDKTQIFVIWLDGYLDAIGDEMNVSKTNVIKNKLNELFEHEAEVVSDTSALEVITVQNEYPPYHFDNDTTGPTIYRC